MRSRADRSRTTAVAILVAAAVCLAGFAVWCTLLIREVDGLRVDVAQRVVWMQRIHTARSAMTPAAREDALVRLRSTGPDLRAALRQDRAVAGAIETLLATAPPPSHEATEVAAGEVVTALRRQTGQLSRTLGEHWNALYWLVGASLFFAASTLGLGVVLQRINATKARSDIERLEAQLLRSDRLAALGTLAATVAHEINNPLAFVVANLELISERVSGERLTAVDDGSEVRQWLRDATAGAERVATIVQDLRTFSHPHADGSATVSGVHEALDAAVRIAEGEARGRAKIYRSFAPPAVHDFEVAASDAQLCQVFLNLLVNAVQAIEPGAPDSNAIQIRTRASIGPDGPHIVIEVQDSGEGIDPSLAERLFDPFVTTKAVGQGTGLGLYVCRGIVDRAGGSIQVTPSAGGGTLAVVSLPLAASTSPSLAPASERRAAVPIAAKRRLLIIDDETGLASALARSLRDFDATVAKNGAEGLAVLLKTDFDVVLCDLMMPGKTGAEVYDEAIVQRPDLRGAFVFMTGGALTAQTESFLQRAEVSVLHKPFSRADVVDALTQVGRAPASLAACPEAESSECA